MFHIATPLYRYEYLERIYQSIPKHEDITWHIAKAKHRPPLTFDFLQDPRVKIYEIDCPDSDTVSKRNTIFDHITDGYFYLLDDDTIFLEEAYHVYNEYQQQNFVGLIIGNQLLSLHSRLMNKAKKPTSDPTTTQTDTGMAICHYSVLNYVRWAWSPANARYDNDFFFWSRCFSYFGDESTLVVDKVFTVYNHFGPKIRVRKQLLGLKIHFDIYNIYAMQAYETIGKLRLIFQETFQLKRVINQKNKFPYRQ